MVLVAEKENVGVQYSNNVKLNRMLNRFTSQAVKNNVWVSIDVKDIHDTRLGDRLADALELVLEYASDTCCELRPPKERIVRLRGRSIQNQVFIKVEFTAIVDEIEENDERIQEIQEIVGAVGGYFKIQPMEKIVEARFSVPTARPVRLRGERVR